MSRCKYYGNLTCEKMHECDRCEVQVRWKENQKMEFNAFRRMTELKPCPFCGSDEIHTYSPGPYETGNDASVSCENPICGAEVRGDTLKEAIAKWNRRANE